MTDEENRRDGDVPEADASVLEIESDLEETRSEMGETLSEIGERLDPARLADDAKQKVRDATVGRVEDAVESAGETARGMTDMVMETIRRNPVPAALAGIGLALLWANRSDGNHDGQQRQSGNQSDSIGSAKRGATDIGGKVGSTAGDAAENVQQFAQDASATARQGAEEMAGQAQRLMNESPMVAGIAALGAGAAVGLLLPGTPLERDLMAEPSGAVIGAAADAASELGSKAQQSIDGAREPDAVTV